MTRTESFEHLFVGKGRVTLAIVIDGTNVRVGYSCCAPQDQFTRARGRMIAFGRANTASLNSFQFTSVGSLIENKNSAISRFLEIAEFGGGLVPHWVTRAVRKMEYVTMHEFRLTVDQAEQECLFV